MAVTVANSAALTAGAPAPPPSALQSTMSSSGVASSDAACAVEVRGLIISAVIFFIVLWLHPYFAGVSPLP